MDPFPETVELNVGGVSYTTLLSTLRAEPDSRLAHMFTASRDTNTVTPPSRDTNTVTVPSRDAQGRYFIDRDGVLFRFVLDYLRNQRRLLLPDRFCERERLRAEAHHFRLPGMLIAINAASGAATPRALSPTAGAAPLHNSSATAKGESGHVTVGYRGTFAFGRDGMADVKFRKLTRIVVGGRVSLCRDAFGDTLNESRDPDRGGGDRYTARFFLTHTFLEQAFDALTDAGFRMVGACASGTNAGAGSPDMGGVAKQCQLQPGATADSEENKWYHYNEFVFYRG